MTVTSDDEESNPDPDLQRKIAASERLVDSLKRLSNNELLRHPGTSNVSSEAPVMPMAVFEEFGKAIKTFRACLQLASTGYGQAALLLASKVVESSLIVLWAINQPCDSVDQLADLHFRYGLQCDLDERRKIGIWKSLPETDYLTEEERAEAVRIFGRDPIGLWTAHSSLASLIEELAATSDDDFIRSHMLGFQVMHDSAVAACAGTGIANHSYRVAITLPDGRPALQVNIGQGTEHCAYALHAATGALLSAFGEVVDHYATTDMRDDVRRCEALLWRAWKDPAELSNLDDTDLCPCDRPGTLWGQCHKWTERLGTIEYTLLTDSDLINFVPYRYGQKEGTEDIEMPAPVKHAGPHILTFTFKLPFTLGLLDSGHQDLMLGDRWDNPDDIAHFSKIPKVRLRLHNEPTNGLELWPSSAGNALRSFYGDIDDVPTVSEWAPIQGTYEQWVTLETPSGRLASESPEDPYYAFHRALNALNEFLLGLDLAVSDIRITSVSTREIGAVVFCGLWRQSEQWKRIGTMIMHPESFPFALNPQSLERMHRQFAGTLNDLRGGRPFLLSNLWHGRALRAWKLRGDSADCVVSLQTASESMLYDLVTSILVDNGMTATEISSRINADLPFKRLLKLIPDLLGGDWHLTGGGTVARYWQSVYLVRNQVVHAGYNPTNVEMDKANDAFLAMREYVSELLWKKYPKYPRTLVAKVGENGLERRGWMTARVRRQCSEFRAEPRPFYWPEDLAGR